MTVSDMSSFKKKKEDEERERKRRSRKRLLQAREHHAWWTNHDCSYCHDPIMAGMWYQRRVFATFFGIIVEKRHLPECPGKWIHEGEEKRQAEEAAAQKKAA
jgi:hypothetical protein